MKKKRLVFCEGPVLYSWVAENVARKVLRHIKADQQAGVERVSGVLNGLRSEGLNLATTVSAAANLVTNMYKGDAPFSGDVGGFPLRKSFARETARILHRDVELLAPNGRHFKRAEELWYAFCQKGMKEAYAQFADYIDAALIMDPPGDVAIPQAILGHRHLWYILSKGGAKTLIRQV